MKLNFIYLFIILSLSISSCADKQTINQAIEFTISEKRSIYLPPSKLSSALPFPPAAFLENNPGLIFLNFFNHSLDTLKETKGGLKITQGNTILSFDNFQLSDIVHLFTLEKSLFLLSNKDMFHLKPEEESIIRYHFDDYPLFRDAGYSIIESNSSFFLNHFFNSLDREKKEIYLFIKSFPKYDFELIKIDLTSGEFYKLPDFYNKELVKKQKIYYSTKGIISKNTMPYLFFLDNHLIVSYSYSNEIDIFDLTHKTSKKIKKETINFPNGKDKIQEDLNNFPFEKAIEMMDDWDRDTSFGAFQFLEEQKVFCRLIRSKTTQENVLVPDLFLELFSFEFEKIGEIKLGKEKYDLSTFYFPCYDGLCFKAKTQENEDVLDYYYLKIVFDKLN